MRRADNGQRPFVGCDDLRDWLLAQGFRASKRQDPANDCNWIAYRSTALPARECETNTGKPMQLVVTPYWLRLAHPEWQSVTVSIVGDMGGGLYDLRAYSLTPGQVRDSLPEIERRLVAAWN